MAEQQAQTISEIAPSQRGMPHAPAGNIPLADGVAKTLFDSSIIADQCLQYMRIQNTGLRPLKVALNNDAGENIFNAILAADTGAGEGNGGVIPVYGAWYLTKVSVIVTGGVGSCAIVKVSNPNGSRIYNQ